MSPPAPCWLVLTDVDAVQSYVFASVRLAMIAGASQIVAEFDGRVAQLAGEHHGRAVIHAGGIGAALFENEEDAAAFGARVEAEFTAETLSGHLTTSVPVRIGGRPHVLEQVDDARASLRRRKDEGFAPGETMTHPLAVRCGGCGREPATKVVPFGTPPDRETWHLGPNCFRKHCRRDPQSWLELLRRVPVNGDSAADWSGLTAENVARDFDRLAGDGDLGLIVADGDGIGRMLDQLDPQTEWETFSLGLDRLFKQSLARALRASSSRFGGTSSPASGPCRCRCSSRGATTS